jgi:hypothetical protein
MEAIGGILAVAAGVGAAIGIVVLVIKKFSPRS